jgi:hypothetical protein
MNRSITIRGATMNRTTKRNIGILAICIVFLMIASACSSKKSSAPELVVEIPSGYSGNFSLQMGVKDAPPLAKQGNSYLLTVSKSGTVATSTLLPASHPVFKNSSSGEVWGYSHRMFATGDGIPVGGRIEFFVGTKNDYDAEQNKKNHSGGLLTRPESLTAGA